MSTLTEDPGVRRVHLEDGRVMHPGGTSVYLVGLQACVMIDSGDGTPVMTEAILEAVEASPIPLRQILITHHHADHWGGAAEIRQHTGAGVRAHPLTIAAIQKAGGNFPIAPLEEGEVITVDGSLHLEVIHTPGHAPGHLCYYLRERRVLFSGDTILGASTTTIGDLGAYLRSLRRLLPYDLRYIWPAHGPGVPQPRERIQAYIDHRLMRERQILEHLQQDHLTSWELVQRIYADVDPQLHHAAERNVLTHLRKLEEEGRVGTIPQGAGQPPRFTLRAQPQERGRR